MSIHTAKPSAQSEAEALEIAKERISKLKRTAANYLARSYVMCLDNPDGLSQKLHLEQKFYFDSFRQIVPIDLEPIGETLSERLNMVNFSGPVMIIANHPPFEKNTSPALDDFRAALLAIGRADLAEGTDGHFPNVIARRAVIANVMGEVFPDKDFRLHVIGAEFFNPPMSTIQARDGSIVVPYGSGTGGFPQLERGMSDVFMHTGETPTPIIVAFPEGGNSKTTVDVLSPFHNGVFAASENYATLIQSPVAVIPLVMGVRNDLSISAKVMDPFLLPPGGNFTQHLNPLHDMMQAEYQGLLARMPNGYFWKGQTYPYGGINKGEIIGNRQ